MHCDDVQKRCNGCEMFATYTVGTGATWDGPIRDGRIVLDHSALASVNAVIRKRNAGSELAWTYFDDSTVLSFTNYTQDPKADVRFWMFDLKRPGFDGQFNPCMLKYFEGTESARQARCLKNEVLAINGFGFSDTTDARFFSKRAWYTYNPNADTAQLLP